MATKIKYRNIAEQMKPLAHGTHVKDMLVVHETVSYNVVGWGDILGIESVLKREGYGIHGITDEEGNMAWALGCGDDIFWHAGGVNTRAVGIEQVSEIPILIQARKLTLQQAHSEWLKRTKQLDATAQLIAGWHAADKKNHPLVCSHGLTPGICSHWDVSQHFSESEGHWDCWPYDGKPQGYYPLQHVIDLAKGYAAKGYHL